MNQNDQQLITQLSEELKKSQPIKTDPQASELIANEVAAQPDAVYALTQAVLLQQAAIEKLQQQVNELQPRKKGLFSSFLGGNAQSTEPNPSAPYHSTSHFGQGSFLGSALTTAAGVAGGMFLFEGISHLFTGGSHVGSESMLNNSSMTDVFQGDPLQGEDPMLNDGFGSGDSFLGDGGGSDGGFDDGFGGGY